MRPIKLLGPIVLAAVVAGMTQSVPPRPLTDLRICGDPYNMPFSNDREEGFENKIAHVVAQDLNATVINYWWPERRGFLRNSILAGFCDVLINVPVGFDPVATTKVYYRSTYYFVYRTDRGLNLHSLDDTLLKHLKIGVNMIGYDYTNTPPAHALGSRGVVGVVGFGLLAFAFMSARHHGQSGLEGLGPARRLVTMARFGLGVLHRPGPAALAAFFQCCGWLCQFFAVYVAMRAFDIHAPFPAAGLVLLLMNVATLFPLWPGNIGLLQAAIALPLRSYGVPAGTAIAYGFGLQAIEASVGVGVGLMFLAREGLSFAMLRRMPDAAEAEVPRGEAEGASAQDGAEARARARVPG